MFVSHLGFLAALTCLAGQAPEPACKSAETAERLWDLGQEAMRTGQPRQAVQLYQRSLAADPTLVRNYLSMAAAYLEMDDETAALTPLAHYVSVRPEQLIIRVHFADLLLRLNRSSEARAEFERCLDSASDQEDVRAQLVHCHTRIMEIAEAENDEYTEHLHRGIGLFLLARQRAALPDSEGSLSSEALLCKAAAELTLAHLVNPDEARPAWYLYEVWSRLAQQQQARRFFRLAVQEAPFSYLTAAEQRGLQLARRCDDLGQPIK